MDSSLFKLKRRKIMRQKTLILLVCMCFLLVGLCACENSDSETESQNFFVNADNIHINLNASILSFDISFLTADKIKDLTYLTCKGKNVNPSKIKVSVTDNRLDSYENLRTEGLYCSDWLIDMTFEEDGEYEIEAITFRIDGTEKTVTFDNPLKYTKGEVEGVFNDELYCSYFPCEFSSSMIGSDEWIEYDFNSDVDCTLTEIKLRSYFDISDAEYYLNGAEQKSTLPIDLKKGDALKVRIHFSNCDDTVDAYSYLMTNLEYRYQYNGETKIKSRAVVFNPLSPMDDKNEKLIDFVKHMVGK